MSNLLVLEKQLLQHKIVALEKEIEFDKLILAEKNKIKNNYSFITNKTDIGSSRIIQHPAKSNKNKEEWHFRHPHNPRVQVRNATFLGLKTTLNEWNPDTSYSFKDNITKECFSSEEEKQIFLKKCILEKEDIENFHIIQAYQLNHEKVIHSSLKDENIPYKICIFNTKEQYFYLRTIFSKQFIEVSKYNNKILSNPSQLEDWYIDHSSLMAGTSFWINLKKIINEI